MNSSIPTMISVEQAKQLIVAALAAHSPKVEQVDLAHAHERICASAYLAPFAAPRFCNSAMDGYAVRASDVVSSMQTAKLTLQSNTLAGASDAQILASLNAIRITTGASLPIGADSVVMLENVRVEGDKIVVDDAAFKSGQHVREIGEDFAQGALIVRPGQRLNFCSLGALASFGFATIRVYAQPLVGVITTGSELVAPGSPLKPGQIYNSNSFTLRALIERCGARARVYETVADDRELIEQTLLRATAECDAVLCSGGASVGEADFMPPILRELGRAHFQKVKQRPGMPVMFAEVGATPVLSLPGNPVSVVASFLSFGVPMLMQLSGQQPKSPLPIMASLSAPIEKHHQRAELIRAEIQVGADGALSVKPTGAQGSAMLSSLLAANGFIVLAEAPVRYALGDLVSVIFFDQYFPA
jgi:molybdopterin molybdotransferase